MSASGKEAKNKEQASPRLSVEASEEVSRFVVFSTLYSIHTTCTGSFTHSLSQQRAV